MDKDSTLNEHQDNSSQHINLVTTYINCLNAHGGEQKQDDCEYEYVKNATKQSSLNK